MMEEANVSKPMYSLTLGDRLVLAVARKYDASLRLCFVYMLSCELSKSFENGFNPRADMQIFTFTTLRDGNIFYYTWKEVLKYSKTNEKMYEKCVARNVKMLKKFEEIAKEK